jgi:CRISPR-associated protein Csx3
VLAGYAVFGASGGSGAGDAPAARPERYLVHPRDAETGLTLSILPMIHAISYDMLAPADAGRHVELINEHLLGPDGARLFDTPITYHGGPERLFRRAESAAYFGREIGLMYTHAHLRYAEAMARLGRADELLLALAQAHPLDSAGAVPQARPRQSFSYYASSDAVFADRYQADARYPELMNGSVAVEGGWRTYSSGPGIWVGLVVEKLLGVSTLHDVVTIDPVLPADLDGLRATVPVAGRTVTVEYRIGPVGAGVTRVVLNGVELPTEPLSNPYRAPGVRVSLPGFLRLLNPPVDGPKNPLVCAPEKPPKTVETGREGGFSGAETRISVDLAAPTLGDGDDVLLIEVG